MSMSIPVEDRILIAQFLGGWLYDGWQGEYEQAREVVAATEELAVVRFTSAQDATTVAKTTDALRRLVESRPSDVDLRAFFLEQSIAGPARGASEGDWLLYILDMLEAQAR